MSASTLPVISAVGHETDFTIVDFVADLRAPTPSAAAELVIRSRTEVEEQSEELDARLQRAMRYRLLIGRQQLTELAQAGAFGRMTDLIDGVSRGWTTWLTGLTQAERAVIESRRKRSRIFGSGTALRSAARAVGNSKGTRR